MTQELKSIRDLNRAWTERLSNPDWETEQNGISLALKALELGELLFCVEMINAMPAEVKRKASMRELLARAYAQLGEGDRARDLLEQIISEGEGTCDTYSLIGRTFKDQWLETGSNTCLLQAIEHYQRAFWRYPENYYPAVNAATLNLIAGRLGEARALAQEVLRLCLPQLSVQPKGADPWLKATVGEATLCLGELEQARNYYQDVGKNPKLGLRARSSARRQARLLLKHLGQNTRLLDPYFDVPSLVVFAGHIVDSPQRLSTRPARFPPELEPFVAKAISAKLEEVGGGIGYASAAAGSDILFLEAMLARKGGEVNIVLSGPKESFKQRSVDIVPEGNWGERFERVLSLANWSPEGSALTHQPADDSLGYVYALKLMCGIAWKKARQLALDLVAMSVWDFQPGDGDGGTADFYRYWSAVLSSPERAADVSLEPINLQKILAESGGAVPTAVVAGPAFPYAPPPSSGRGLKFRRMQQDIKSILFADVAHFSKLSEDQLPRFFDFYMGAVSNLIAESPNAPIIADTWGDGLYMVFDEAKEAGLFALELKKRLTGKVASERWRAFQLPQDLRIRIALHTGPVFSVVDPVTRRIAFTGRHVSQAARLEPITEAGQIFTTEGFAAIAFAEQIDDFRCEYVGRRQLPKSFGEIGVYRLAEKNPEEAEKRVGDRVKLEHL